MRWRVILAVVLALAGLIFLAWLISKRGASDQAQASASAASPAESNPDRQGVPATNSATDSRSAASSNSISALPLPPLPWDMRRDGLLRSDAPTAEKADRLLGMLPELAPAEQEEAARHLVNLLGDDQYASAGAWLTNAQAPEAVQSLLMADLMNRPDRVRLPLYLVIARTPDHPRAAEAKYLLSVHLPDDYGTNWAAWEAAVQTRLQEQPEK